ncbi:TPA_asm: RNA-directed RNA polymerase, partial [ssRNA phage Gerhypos.4_59]
MRINADVLYSNLLVDLGDVVDPALPSWAVDSTSKQVACYLLRDTLLKKFNEEEKPSPNACLAAFKKFTAVNDKCAEWSLVLDRTSDEELINSVKMELYRFWYVGGDSPLISDLREVYLEGRAGPGASISARGQDFYTKMFDSPLSSTRGLPEIWERCVSMGGLSFEAEASRLLNHGYDVVESSRYSFVNKTTAVARGICTEPTINMWFQLGIGRMLERRLGSFYGIWLDTQPNRNRELARAGSIDGTVCTIDLESASDSLGLKMLREMLPRSWMALLEMFRCPSTILPTGSVLDLNMVSTMGNGFTFPMQTILFSAVVKGVAKRLGVKTDSSNFGVFGDDIICPSSIYRTVKRVLTILGFVVNSDKTFVEGPFRESCGADYHLGMNVRGVYIKKLLTLQDLFVAINNLNRWSAKTGVFLNRSVCYLASFLRHGYPVPLDENDDAGIHTPLYFTRNLRRNKVGSIGYKARAPSEYAFYILGDVIWTFRDQVRRNYNPAGLYISLLFGGIRGYRVLLRQRRVLYVTKRRSTPRWDWLPPRPLEGLHGPQGYRRLVDAWYWNLLGSSFGT